MNFLRSLKLFEMFNDCLIFIRSIKLLLHNVEYTLHYKFWCYKESHDKYLCTSNFDWNSWLFNRDIFHVSLEVSSQDQGWKHCLLLLIYLAKLLSRKIGPLSQEGYLNLGLNILHQHKILTYFKIFANLLRRKMYIV